MKQPKKVATKAAKPVAKKAPQKAVSTYVKKPNILESKYSDSLNKSSKLHYKIAKEYANEGLYRQIPGSSQQKFSMDESMRLLNIGHKDAREYEKSKNKFPSKKK